jgi:hypothetical protein
MLHRCCIRTRTRPGVWATNGLRGEWLPAVPASWSPGVGACRAHAVVAPCCGNAAEASPVHMCPVMRQAPRAAGCRLCRQAALPPSALSHPSAPTLGAQRRQPSTPTHPLPPLTLAAPPPRITAQQAAAGGAHGGSASRGRGRHQRPGAAAGVQLQRRSADRQPDHQGQVCSGAPGARAALLPRLPLLQLHHTCHPTPNATSHPLTPIPTHAPPKPARRAGPSAWFWRTAPRSAAPSSASPR